MSQDDSIITDMNDEVINGAIFKRRLIYDGKGGEDKRLMILITNIAKLCPSDAPNEEQAKLYNFISNELTAAIQAAERTGEISQMLDKTNENLNKRIGEEAEIMSRLKMDLDNMDVELKYAKRLRKVNEFPNSIKAEKTIQDLERKRQAMCLELEKLGVKLTLITEAFEKLQKAVEDEKPEPECINLTDSEL